MKPIQRVDYLGAQDPLKNLLNIAGISIEMCLKFKL